VEAGLDVSETKGYSFENIHADLPFCPPKKQFGDQLLGMFCIKWLKMSKGGSQVPPPDVSFSLASCAICCLTTTLSIISS
jgi:hypothetical protein